MPNGIDLNAATTEAATTERLLTLSTTDEGAPPAIERVVADYKEVIRLMNWLGNAAALLRYEALGHGDDLFLDRFRERVLSSEKTSGTGR